MMEDHGSADICTRTQTITFFFLHRTLSIVEPYHYTKSWLFKHIVCTPMECNYSKERITPFLSLITLYVLLLFDFFTLLNFKTNPNTPILLFTKNVSFFVFFKFCKLSIWHYVCIVISLIWVELYNMNELQKAIIFLLY